MHRPVALWILVALVGVWMLRAASSLLVPIVIAVCISYALEPVVAWMSHRMPRLAATSALLLVVFAGAGWGAYSLREEAGAAIEALPQAARRLNDLVRGQGGTGPIASLQKAGAELLRASGTGNGVEAGVEEEGSAAGANAPAGLVDHGVGSVFVLAGHTATVVFLTFFLLAAGDHFTHRLVEVMDGAERKRVTLRIMRDINRQIQRFLLVRAVTGVIVGVATWAALAWLGTEQAAVWGILAGVFNSIPYFGPVIVSGGLLAVGVLQGDLGLGLRMGGVALVITSIEGWLITPPLLGRAERMSALVLFLGLLFWTWMWGAWGTLLAVPMLVVIKAIADRVEPLRPVGRLMAP